MHSDAHRDEPGPGLRELDPAGFAAQLGELMSVYATAMRVPAVQLPGRRAIMESHLGHPEFRAIVLTAPPDTVAPLGTPGRWAPGDRGRHGGAWGDGGVSGSVIAFTYGFRGEGGQWWHEMVRLALTKAAGDAVAAHWLEDSFEVAELHVRPEYQQQGIGRRLLFTLTGGRPERTALLSTMDAESPARRLYRSAGFTDLLTNYTFSGADASYAVMGAPLPLSTRPLRSRNW